VRQSTPIVWPKRAIVAAVVLCFVAAIMGCGSSEPDFEGSYVAAPTTWVEEPLAVQITPAGDGYVVEAPPQLFGAPGTVEDGRLVVNVTSAGSPTQRVVFERIENDRLAATWSSPSSESPAETSVFAPIDQIGDAGGDALDTEHFKREMQRSSDLAVGRRIDALEAALAVWATSHSQRFPSLAQLRPGGAFWTQGQTPAPANAFTGEPMAPGENPGDFSYTVSPDRSHFTLTGHQANGGFVRRWGESNP
jgi:hypothetical protein